MLQVIVAGSVRNFIGRYYAEEARKRFASLRVSGKVILTTSGRHEERFSFFVPIAKRRNNRHQQERNEKKMGKVICLLGLLLMPISMAMGSNLLDGLVGYWPFDGNANDISGNGNNGIIHGVTLTKDRHGNSDSAYHFNGKSWIEVANSGSLYNITREITIAAWIKPTSWSCQNDEGDKWLTVLQKGSSSNHFEFQYGKWAKAGVSYVSLDYWNGAFIENKNVNIPSLGVWQFVVITLSAGKLKSYKNGVLQDSLNVGVALIPNGSSLYIGANPVGNCEYFIGTMDNVAIYNRALSASEIKALSKFIPTTLEIRNVSFNPNDGSGEMEDDVFEEGKDQKLSKNTYTKDGYVFQGWAETKADADNGFVKYRDEALITVNHDMTLYAVWATFEPVAADWGVGSITLKATGVSLKEGEDFFLSFCDAATADSDGAQWEYVDDFGKTVDGNSVSVTDSQYSSRLGGIPAVRYRLQIGKSKDDVRATMCCTTRNRHGLFVGVGEFENGEERGLSRLPGVASDASEFKRIAEEYAKFIGPVYTNQEADTNTVDATLEDFVESSQIGDICLFYVTTHGGYDGGEGVFCLYDGDYTHSDLAEKVSRMASKGIAFVAIVGTCHAEAMLQMDFPNAAVVAAATMNDLSTATFDKILMNDGWEKCCAANGSIMTFGNLADYAIEKYNGIFAEINFVDEKGEECYPYCMSATKNDVGGLLGKIVARADCNPTSNSATKPSGVVGFSATTNNSSRVTVSWDSVDGTDRYYLFFGRLGQYLVGYKEFNRDETDYTLSALWNDWIKESSKAAPIQFMIKAYNVDAGAGPAVITKGWLYKTYAISFYTIDHERIEWEEPSFDRSYDDSVFKTFELGDEYVLKFLPEAKKSGHYLKGWYDLDGNEAIVGQTFSSDAMYHAEWKEIAMPQTWLDDHIGIVERSGGDLATAAAMTAANGTRTVDECYRLGIDPEDPNDDLKITDFKMEDGKPVITLNHTKDGSGNSFESRIKTLGKANLTDADWVDVTDKDQSAYRFFKVTVDLP